MKHVRVRITARGHEREIHPMYGVLTRSSFVDSATAIQWNYTGEALGILHFVEGEADAFEAAVREIPEVLGYELLRVEAGAFYAYVGDATTESLRDLFDRVTHEGLVVPPMVYHEDGTVSFSMFGPDAEIQAAIEAVPHPVEVTFEAVSGLAATVTAAGTRLSDRQREALDVALSLGYYEIPREGNHEDVAEAMGCAASTAAEHLRKAEAKVVRSVMRG
jgi:hypothetical protein